MEPVYEENKQLKVAKEQLEEAMKRAQRDRDVAENNTNSLEHRGDELAQKLESMKKREKGNR